MVRISSCAWTFAAAVGLSLAAGSSAFGQLPPPGEAPKTPPAETVQAPPPPKSTVDPGLSSKPPSFTIPPGEAAPTPTAKDGTAPAVTNDTNPFAGFPQVQDALADLLPGNFKNTKYEWYGFVRLDGIYDFNPIGSTDDFVTSSIPIPQGKGRNFVLTPRYTRLGFDTLTPLEEHDWQVKTRIEMDFFNGNTSGVFGSFPLRLRFAWIDVGPFLVGQAASLFMDYDVFPNVLDYEGPPGMVLMRQPIIAYRYNIADNLRLSVGVEHPYSDIQWFEDGGFVVNPNTGIITTAGVPKNIQGLPDFTANLRYTFDYGHLQVAGILRKLEFQTAAEENFIEWGYGINVTGAFRPWAYLHGVGKGGDCDTCDNLMDKSRILGQFACGRGISRYIQDINGFGLDAVWDPASGFQTIQAQGWFLSYEQWWTDKLASVFTYGQTWVDVPDVLPADTYKNASYFAVNLIWLPVERLGMGIEFLYGSRENKDGNKGKACRIQTGVQYKF
jgi:DcaP outer membrane protein